jgi:hypothetical protein
MSDTDTVVSEEAHKELHRAYAATNGQRSRAQPISAQVAQQLERLTQEADAKSLSGAHKSGKGGFGLTVKPVVLDAKAHFDADTIPIPSGLKREEFKGLLAAHLKHQVIDLSILQLTVHCSGTSINGHRIETARADDVFVSFPDGQSCYYRVQLLIKAAGAPLALVRQWTRDNSPQANLEAYIRCRTLPFILGKFNVIDFSLIQRPVQMCPDFSTDRLTLERLPQFKTLTVERWFLHKDPYAPRKTLRPTPPRLKREISIRHAKKVLQVAQLAGGEQASEAPLVVPQSAKEVNEPEEPSTDLLRLIDGIDIDSDVEAMVREVQDADTELAAIEAEREALLRKELHDDGPRRRRLPSRFGTYYVADEQEEALEKELEDKEMSASSEDEADEELAASDFSQ